MNKKNILFITTAFSPENAVGSVRTTKIVKFLVRNNYSITVISPKLYEDSSIDYSIECEELKHIKRIVIPHSKYFERVLLKKRNKMLKKKSATSYITKKNKGFISSIKSQYFIIIHFFYTIIRNFDWSLNVKKYLSKNTDLLKNNIVISSYPSLSAHWISYYLSKKHNKFWIADFRDPINYHANSNFFVLFLNTYFQNKIIKQADYVTCVSNDLLLKLNVKNKIDKNKFKYIPNGFDNDDINYNEISKNNCKSKVLKLCYVGSLYGGKRDLNVLFKAIRELINEKKIKTKYIEVSYAGKEFSTLEKVSNKFRLDNILKNEGYVSRLESMKIQSNSDLIIIITWNTKMDKGVIPGKLYECLLTNKLILGIVNGNEPKSELKTIVSMINGGIVYEDSSNRIEEEFLLLKDFILKKYNEKQKNKILKSTYNSNVYNYSYTEIANSFIKLLNE